MTDQKAGNRNNTSDRKRIREIRQCVKRAHDITIEMEPDDEDKKPEMLMMDDEPDEEEDPKAAKLEGIITIGGAYIDGLAVKAAGEWALDVLGIPFGSPAQKDSDGQYFDRETKLHLADGEETPVYYFHGLTPEGKPQAEPEKIGVAKFNHTDDKGHWFRVTLDKASEYARRVWDAAKNGIARASSGSIAHLVRVARDGHILSWPFAELSIFDTDRKRQPANQAAIVAVAKAQFHPVGQQPEATAEAETRGAADISKNNLPVKGFLNMEKEDLIKLLDERDAQKAAADKAKADEQARIDAAVKTAVEAKEKEWAAKNRLPFNGQAPHVTQFGEESKWDNYTAEDLSFGIEVLRSNFKAQPPSAGLLNALALKCADLTGEHGQYVKSAMKASGIDPVKTEIEKAIKAATDPAYSTLSDAGAEWVGTAYSNAIWEAIRSTNRVVSKIPSVVIPDGYSSEYFPLESTDPTWYKVAETTAADSTMKIPVGSVTASQMATAQKQITVAKMGARVMYTGELVEDSLIPYAAQLRKQLEASGADMMEYVVIDGDTATSSNINDIGGTTYSGTATTLFLLTNGFRKSCLVTTTANSRSAAGSLSENDFLETVWLMGTAGLNGADLAKTSFVIDPNVYKQALKLSTVKTKDVWSSATLEKGQLASLWGYEIIPSWNMHRMSTVRKANTAGKVDNDTTTNNAYGSILAVRWDQWKIAYKRRMTMETTRRPESDSWEIVALSRWGLGQRDTEASAVSYYVGV